MLVHGPTITLNWQKSIAQPSTVLTRGENVHLHFTGPSGSTDVPLGLKAAFDSTFISRPDTGTGEKLGDAQVCGLIKY